MAWGLWNKIKQGFKKVGSAVKSAAKFVNDKIVKPFKPVITKVADTLLPGSGRVVEAVSDGIDEVANGNFRGAANRVIGMPGISDSSAGYSRPNPRADGIRPYRKLNF